MRKVPLSMLTPDMVLGRPVSTNSNILINAGVRDLDQYVRRLELLGINFLYIEDEVSDGIEINELIQAETRTKCKYTLQKSFQRINTHFSVNMNDVVTITRSLIDDILSSKGVLYNINEIGSMEDNTLDHSLNTTVYAICLGRQLGYNKTQLKHLATGTLLHDIGKTALNHNILFKPGRLSAEEFEHVKSHTQLGYELLCKDSQIPEATRQVCLCHHERIDGSGYPFGRQGDELHDYVKIASIVDVYEALTVKRCYHNAITPLQAMDILTQEATSKLDFNLVSIFNQNIAVYPTGTNVLLSDGRYGIVRDQNESFPLRPVVRVIEKRNGKFVSHEEINLLTTLNLTITASDMPIPSS